MKADPFTDAVMGEWKIDNKTKIKDKLCYKRTATITLHKDHAQEYIQPITYKKKVVHGEVVLTERKVVDKETSRVDMFREVGLTPKSIIIDVIQ